MENSRKSNTSCKEEKEYPCNSVIRDGYSNNMEEIKDNEVVINTYKIVRTIKEKDKEVMCRSKEYIVDSRVDADVCVGASYSISNSSAANFSSLFSSSSSLFSFFTPSFPFSSSSSSSVSFSSSYSHYKTSDVFPSLRPINVSSPLSSSIVLPSLMKLQSYTFNQDFSCFVCATTAGIRVYTCTPLSEFCRLEYPIWGIGSYDVATMLFRTNVFAVVSTRENKKVKLWDDQRKRFIGELRSRQQIINVCLGRDILAMITEYQIYIYQSEQMHPYNIINTGTNLRGLCVVTSGFEKDRWKLACPAIAPGAVRIHTSEREDTSHVFQAHQTSLVTLSFNSNGSMLATASETGTVVRVFSVLDGLLLHEFRRGTHTHTISCLTFRPDNMFLAVASSSNTLHIFKLSKQTNENQSNVDIINSHGDGEILAAGSITHLVEGKNTLRGYDESYNNSFTKKKTNYQAYMCEADNTNRVDFFGTVLVSTPKGKGFTSTVSSQMNQPIIAGKDLTSVVYDTSKEMMQDVLKGVLPRYFMSTRSFAQFHISDDSLKSLDVRSPTSSIAGPLCAFAGEKSNHIYLLHYNGLFYEFRFDSLQGRNECTLLNATKWFSPRPDFRIASHLDVQSFPSELEGGFDGDEWQIVL